MAVPVKHPVYNAMNKRLLVFGVRGPVFMAALLTGAGVFYLSTLLPAAAVFAGVLAAARMLTREDPDLPRVLLASAKQSRIYDASLR